MHNPEADHSAFFGEHTEDLSPGNNLSALRHCSEEVREEPGYTGVLVNKQKTGSIKRLLLERKPDLSLQ